MKTQTEIIDIQKDQQTRRVSVVRALEELKQGKMIVMVDDRERENEGDLVMAAEHVTPEAINFMAKYGRGLICVALTQEKAQQLDLPLMVESNTSLHQTGFTVSIDAREGVSTGISAADRARTVELVVSEKTEPRDLVRPGHIFPLLAREGGVLVRTGHTEGSVDMMRLAGLTSAAVICEIMNDDGTMARMDDLERFAREHDLSIVSVADIIQHRMEHERLVHRISEARLPLDFDDDFTIFSYGSQIDHKEHVALVKGDVSRGKPVLVRVHSECLTGDVFGSARCDCGAQMEASLRMISEEGRGVFLYIRQEGRGIGLHNKLKAYALQDQGFDTVDANEQLGFLPDLRHYGIGAQILVDLGVKKMRLLTNNPKKLVGLKGYGLELVDRVPIEMEPTIHNERYLRTKRERLGHLLQKV